MKHVFVGFLLLFVSSGVNAEWQKLSLETITEYRVLNGEIEAVNKATMSSQTSGRVESFYYDVDDFVAQGSTIVEFTNVEQKANLKQAKANAEAARVIFQQSVKDYNRTKDVYSKKLIAKSMLDKALSNKNSLKARLDAATSMVISAEKQLEYTIIRAPYDGIVTKRHVEVGEVVSPGSAIMEGLSLDKLRVISHIPESVITKIKGYSTAKIISNGKSFIANKITIFPYANQMSHTFKSRLEFDSTNGQLFPGMTVKVAFKVGDYQAIKIPKSALIYRSELSLVYVKYQNKKILRQIKLGKSDHDKVEIIAGLSVGDEIFITP